VFVIRRKCFVTISINVSVIIVADFTHRETILINHRIIVSISLVHTTKEKFLEDFCKLIEICVFVQNSKSSHSSADVSDHEKIKNESIVAEDDNDHSHQESGEREVSDSLALCCIAKLLADAKDEDNDDNGDEYHSCNNSNEVSDDSSNKDKITLAATAKDDAAAVTVVADDDVIDDSHSAMTEEFDLRDFGLHDDVQETMMEKRWADTLIYPCPHEFKHSFMLLLKHQSIYWNTVETDLREDYNSLSVCPEDVKRLVFRANAMLASGDKIVTNMFETKAFQRITSPQIKAFFVDQNAREAIHQISYSKILELCHSDEYRAYLRSDNFIHILCAALEGFNEAAFGLFRFDAYPAFMLLLLMCVERLMFCVPFAINMYAGVCGYAPKIADITSMVMRDENLHYHHARGLLSSLRVRLNKSVVSEILMFYRECMRDVIHCLFIHDWDEVFECPLRLDKPLVIAQCGDHPCMSLELAYRYFDYEYYWLLYENGVIDSVPEQVSDESTFPFPFMRVNEQEVQSNLMESASTIYATTHA